MAFFIQIANTAEIRPKKSLHQNFKTRVPCVLQILTTFRLYCGGTNMGL